MGDTPFGRGARGRNRDLCDLGEDEPDPMSSLLARPQFRMDLFKEEALGIQKTLKVVRIVLIGS
jgi:hypothetical protein